MKNVSTILRYLWGYRVVMDPPKSETEITSLYPSFICELNNNLAIFLMIQITVHTVATPLAHANWLLVSSKVTVIASSSKLQTRPWSYCSHDPPFWHSSSDWPLRAPTRASSPSYAKLHLHHGKLYCTWEGPGPPCVYMCLDSTQKIPWLIDKSNVYRWLRCVTEIWYE